MTHKSTLTVLIASLTISSISAQPNWWDSSYANYAKLGASAGMIGGGSYKLNHALKHEKTFTSHLDDAERVLKSATKKHKEKMDTQDYRPRSGNTHSSNAAKAGRLLNDIGLENALNYLRESHTGLKTDKRGLLYSSLLGTGLMTAGLLGAAHTVCTNQKKSA